MNHAQRPTVAEAIRIGERSCEFQPAYNFLRDMMNVYQCHPIDSDNEWNLVCMLFNIYNAGRIYGIRQERARRKVRFKGDKSGGQIDSFSADELEKGLQFLYKISEIRFRETLDAKHQCMADAYRISMDLVESERNGEIGRYDLTKHGIGCSDA